MLVVRIKDSRNWYGQHKQNSQKLTCAEATVSYGTTVTYGKGQKATVNYPCLRWSPKMNIELCLFSEIKSVFKRSIDYVIFLRISNIKIC
ncbi:hypothetical protein HanPSC8_Chr06g0256901 [Helianthus annuus]|nr:hypothetical protein HanPSC8_Chr06g0256901 [Helianthus annuus]